MNRFLYIRSRVGVLNFLLLTCLIVPGLVRAEVHYEGSRPELAGQVDCGSWSVVGPFKEDLFGPIIETFNTVYPPEEQVLAAGRGEVDSGASWTVPALPGMNDTLRRWSEHAEWVDGYRHLLPRGPAPSRSETVYLTRNIECATDLGLQLHLYAEDFIRVWLNGEVLAEVERRYGPSRFPTALRTELPLKAGANRLLVKISSLHAAHGFAFSIPELHPHHDLVPGQWSARVHRQGEKKVRPGGAVRPLCGPAAADDAGLAEEVERFRFSLRPVPMFDPPRVEMAEAGRTESDAAASYAREREALEAKLGTDPEALDRFWRNQAGRLAPVLFVRRPYRSVNAIAPYWGRGSFPASICRVDPARSEAPVETVFHDPELSIHDINLSWDGKTIFFSAHRGKAGRWQIYAVGSDGSGLRRITHNDAADHLSPVELPSGRLMFVSTQGETWVQCQGKKAGLLYSCAADGSDMRKVSANIDSDHTPQVMADGRVMFTRWDYGVEKNVFARHALWLMNPDGSGFELFFGNTIEDPAGFWKARPIPGRPEVVCVFGPHHSDQAGMLGIVSDRRGPEAPRGKGFRFITDEVPSYCDTRFANGYQDPFPLHERLFLVSYGGDAGGRNRIYLIDELGNRRCLVEAEDPHSCFYPIPQMARERPPVIAPQGDNPEWVYSDPETANNEAPDQWGTLLVQDVYQGIEARIARGEVKEIQVMEQVQKSRCMAGGEAWGHTPIIGRGTVHVRRVVGTVPVEEDGSAYFEAPALRSISLNLLDAEGKTLVRMGSDMHLVPGETRSCIGCHENRYGEIAPPAPGSLLALAKPPQKPELPEWRNTGLLDYQQVVQPVWDQHCVSCHGGGKPAADLSLAGDRTRFFSVSYDNLVERGWVDHSNVFALDHDETTPLSVGATVSRILPYLEKEHSGTTMSADQRRRVFAWIDANVPYYGTYDYAKVRGIGARDSWETAAGKNEDGWLVGHVAEVFRKRCLACHARTVHNQALYGARSFTVSSRYWTTRGLTAHGFPGRYPMSALVGPELRINLTKPADSLILQAPLAESAGGIGRCRSESGEPVFASRADPDYERMLVAIEAGRSSLYATPRKDMDVAHVAAVKPKMLDLEGLQDRLAEFRPPSAGMILPEKWKVVKRVPGDWINVAGRAKLASRDKVRLDGKPPRVSVAAAADGDPGTLWDDVDGQALYRLSATFERPVEVVGISLQGWAHHKFAPRDFTVMVDGRTLGRIENARYTDNRLVFKLPATPCTEVELRIDGSHGGSPAIREWGIHALER